jgi:hypothetical protein
MNEFKGSEFRAWCMDKWYEHKEELLLCEKRITEYSSKEYFAKYKYWLKRQFQYETKSKV